jgi:6-phosphofructokinase 1
MGRDAGDIALNAGIGAGAEEILIPEQNMGKERLIESLRRSKKTGKTSSIVVVSEGDQIGKNIFGLATYIEDRLKGYEVRVTVLGHVQRGGSPSCRDRVLASRMGIKAVDALLNNESDVMIGIHRTKILSVPFSEALKGDNKLDMELIRVADITSI